MDRFKDIQTHISSLSEMKILQQQHPHMSYGFIEGCFDILHPGHLTLFAFAKQRVDKLIVVVMSDASIASSKSTPTDPRPKLPQEARCLLLAHLRSVDYVIPDQCTLPFSHPQIGENYRSYLQELRLSAIFTTKQTDRHRAEKKKIADEMHIPFVLHEQVLSYSTTGLVR